MGGTEEVTTRALGTAATEPRRRASSPRRSAPPVRPEPVPGETIGRYALLERLGAGGMGVVFRAHDAGLDRQVALKVLRGPTVAPGEPSEGRARLLREAQAMAQLSHPHVVEVFDVGSEDGVLYIAMALVEGQTLREWLAARARGVHEIAAIFVQAGRGLAAAHAAGLVHRDFKPGNVLVDGHDHARVVDFGLALSASRAEVPAEPGLADDLLLASSSMITSRLTTPVTEVGMVMGTPAYMAPEQHGGQAVGPAADQFAFCVALYEALYGARPFTGGTAEALWRAKRAGDLPPPPAGHPVPAALHRVLATGLRPRAEDRWPTMDALLHALEPFARPRSRRRAWGWGALGAAALAVGLAAWWAWPRPGGDATCLEARAALAQVWGEPQRQALRTALAAGSAAYAADTARRVEARLDDYASRWLALHEQVCDGNEALAGAAAAVRERRLECLERRRRRMATLVEVLADARTDVLAQAAGLVQGLPALEGCAAEDPDDDDLVLPDDPATALRVREIHGALEEVQALLDAGQYDRAHARAAELHGEAEGLGYAPLTIRTETFLGDALLHRGQRQDAEARLVHALHQAELADDDAMVVLVVTRLVHLTGDRPEEGLRWARHGQARLSRIPENAPAQAMMRMSLGTALAQAGQGEEAVAELSQAVALWAKLAGPDDLQAAAARNNLGIAYYGLGRFADAIAEYEEVLRIRQQAFGPDHPDVAAALNNLANASMELGQPARALELQHRALTIWRGALGPDHPDLGASYSNLGNAARAVGRVAEAEAVYERSIEIRERALGSEHPELAISLLNHGTLLGELGRYDAAASTLRRARSILERTMGDHPWTAAAIGALGTIAAGRGDHEAAVTAQQQALDMLRAVGLAEHPMALEVRRRLGEAHLGTGQPALARPPLEEALAIQEQRGGLPPEESAALAFALARTLRAAGDDPARARSLAERALATWRGSPPWTGRPRARVEAFLREPDVTSP